MHTIFAWFNAMATISLVPKINLATIQGWLLFEGGVYYTALIITWLLIKLGSNSKKFQVHYLLYCTIMPTRET